MFLDVSLKDEHNSQVKDVFKKNDNCYSSSITTTMSQIIVMLVSNGGVIQLIQVYVQKMSGKKSPALKSYWSAISHNIFGWKSRNLPKFSFWMGYLRFKIFLIGKLHMYVCCNKERKSWPFHITVFYISRAVNKNDCQNSPY